MIKSLIFFIVLMIALSLFFSNTDLNTDLDCFEDIAINFCDENNCTYLSTTSVLGFVDDFRVIDQERNVQRKQFTKEEFRYCYD